MKKYIYDSRDTAYKAPYGAVPTGTTITFSLYPVRGAGTAEISLFIAREGDAREQYRIYLQWNGLEGEQERYTCTYRVQAPGVYWYYFHMRNKQGTFYISRGFGGKESVGRELTERFQITVYDSTYAVPDWFGQGITYNIFPDRFYRTRIPAENGYRAERVIHPDWDDTPRFLPDENGEVRNNDFFGGSLDGIREKLPVLAQLHVRTIYLNPIFEAYSNHRYDTGNYKTIDPMLGTEQDFRELCREATQYGMRIILDGVFNHTGFDSLYFNGRGHYDSVGAYQSQDSPYAQWYDFQQWPDRYGAWWGIYTLPQVNETCEGYRRYILEDEDSVIRHWLRLGASGWRLDVADELPDSFIKALNVAARTEKKDALVLGEVWEDASNKIAYGVRREYFQGGELDSVMNYPLRDAILRYLGGEDAACFAEVMETLRENYPHDVFHSLMNIIGTHDTPRILSVLGSDCKVWELDKTAQARYTLSEQEYERGIKKLKMAAVLQFSMPGSPCIYYGDEAGMQGYEDPLNRRTYPWGREDQEILAFYRELCVVRAESPALQCGELRFLQAEGDVLLFQRCTPEECMTIAVNSGGDGHKVVLPHAAVYDVLRQELFAEEQGAGVEIPMPGETARILRCAD